MKCNWPKIKTLLLRGVSPDESRSQECVYVFKTINWRLSLIADLCFDKWKKVPKIIFTAGEYLFTTGKRQVWINLAVFDSFLFLFLSGSFTVCLSKINKWGLGWSIFDVCWPWTRTVAGCHEWRSRWSYQCLCFKSKQVDILQVLENTAIKRNFLHGL